MRYKSTPYQLQIEMETRNLEEIASRTLQLLEWRLKRLEFLLTGKDTPNDDESSKSTDHASITVTKRIHKLEQSLHRLASKSDTVSALIKLRTCSYSVDMLTTNRAQSYNLPISSIKTPQIPLYPTCPSPRKRQQSSPTRPSTNPAPPNYAPSTTLAPSRQPPPSPISSHWPRASTKRRADRASRPTSWQI